MDQDRVEGLTRWRTQVLAGTACAWWKAAFGEPTAKMGWKPGHGNGPLQPYANATNGPERPVCRAGAMPRLGASWRQREVGSTTQIGRVQLGGTKQGDTVVGGEFQVSSSEFEPN